MPTLSDETLRSRADGRRPRAGVAGGSRHRLRGGLHAGGGRRHRADDAGHAAFEIAGDLFHRRPPVGVGARLYVGFLLFKPANAQCIVLEYLDGRGHRADLVAAADAGNFAVQPALGEVLHAGAELNERLRNAAADHARRCCRQPAQCREWPARATRRAASSWRRDRRDRRRCRRTCPSRESEPRRKTCGSILPVRACGIRSAT